jgi:hypothetical protein
MSKTSSSKPKYSPTYYGGMNGKERCSLLECDVQIYQVPLHKMANSHRTPENR